MASGYERFMVEAYAWLRYMELPYLGPGLLVKWERPPSLHNIIEPSVVKEIVVATPKGRVPGALVLGSVPRSLHGVALPLPRGGGSGLYRVGLGIELGVYTRAEVRGYGGTVQACVYGGKKEAEAIGLRPVESTLIKGYATTHMILGYSEKTSIGEVEPLGFPLEIVPMQLSNMFSPGEVLEIQVLREGKPLANAEVTVTYIDGSHETVKANESGIAVVRLGPSVTVVSAEHVEPADHGDDYDKVKETATLSIQALTV